MKKTIFEIKSYISTLYENKFYLLCDITCADLEINDVGNEKEIDSCIIRVKKLLKEI